MTTIDMFVKNYTYMDYLVLNKTCKNLLWMYPQIADEYKLFIFLYSSMIRADRHFLPHKDLSYIRYTTLYHTI